LSWNTVGPNLTDKLCTSTSDNNIDVVLEDTRLNPQVPRDFVLRLLISVRQKSMPRAHIFPKYPSIIISAFRRFSLPSRVGLTGCVRPGE